MDPRTEHLLQLTRRQLLSGAAGAAAMTTLMQKDGFTAPVRQGGLPALRKSPAVVESHL